MQIFKGYIALDIFSYFEAFVVEYYIKVQIMLILEGGVGCMTYSSLLRLRELCQMVN